MKVFVVFEKQTYDFDTNVDCSVFSTKELAREEYERRVANAKIEGENALDEDEIVIEENKERMAFNLYKDGYASQWETAVWVAEKEVDEV